MGQLGDLSPQGSVAIGIIVGLLSTSIQSLGLTLQRKSHLLEDEKDVAETRRPPYKRRRWQLGMLMFVVSNLVGSTIQITTLPLPVLSTLQASGLVFNTAFATLLLKERFTRFSLIGTVLTCTGAALIAIFGAIGEPAHSLSQLLILLKQRQFIYWMTGTLLVVVATILFAHVLKSSSSHKHFEIHHLPIPDHSHGMSFSATNLSNLKRSFTANLPVPLQRRMVRMRLIRGLCYALISGILSAHSLLVAKSAVELLVRTIIDHDNQFNRFQSWLILIALLFFALSQLYYLHLGLRLCSTSVLYPFVFCIYNIIAILDGLIYFQQASRLSPLHSGLIAVGTVILLSGVLSLSWRLDDTSPTDPGLLQQGPTPSPLTPGMGLISSSENVSTSPILPTSSRRRSSTSASRRSINEHTPLIYRRPTRAPTLSVIPPPPDTQVQEIWAELDDSEENHDVLASLPRAPSPFLSQSSLRIRPRSRGDSISSYTSAAQQQTGDQSPRPPPRGSDSSEDNLSYRPVRRPLTPQDWRKDSSIGPKARAKSAEYRRSSAPGAARIGLAGRSPARRSTQSQERELTASPVEEVESLKREVPQEQKARSRSNTASGVVRFAKGPLPSRWDTSVSGPSSGVKDKTENGKQAKKIDEQQGQKDPGG